MVTNKRHGGEGIQKVVVARQTPIELEEIGIVDRTPDGFPQFVLRHGVNVRLADIGCVVTMNNLPNKPCIGEFFTHSRHNLCPKFSGNLIGGIKTPPRHTSPHPVQHHLNHKIHNALVGVVKFHQPFVPLKSAEGRSSCIVPRHMKHRLMITGRPLFDYLSNQRVGAADMVKHTIKNHRNALVSAHINEVNNIIFSTQSRVNSKVINSVIAVGFCVENRP